MKLSLKYNSQKPYKAFPCPALPYFLTLSFTHTEPSTLSISSLVVLWGISFLDNLFYINPAYSTQILQYLYRLTLVCD